MKFFPRSLFGLALLFSLLTTGILQGDSSANPSAKYIQRTMKALEESTAEEPAQIRVMFYGQSIVSQQWTSIVQKALQERYPTVQFTFVNKAIGGYQASSLIRTAECDLYPWYPDLLFFHVYGDLEKYRQIIQNVRERTTAEIILWSSHLSANQDPEVLLENRDERTTTIEKIACDWKCMYIDLNQKWCRLLLQNQWPAQHLLRDNVHLKKEGCEYYAQFILEELVRLPGTEGDESSCGKISRISVDDPAVGKNPDSSFTLTFHGNRVCAIPHGKEKAAENVSLLLDGRPVSEYRELWATTRPSKGPRWMPAINTILFEAPLQKESWTLTALSDSAKDGSRIHFRVTGSVTGEDGEGWSDERFVSRSRRVIIEPTDYATWQYRLFKAELPENYQVTWKSYPLFAESLMPASSTEPILLLQNCTNAPHTLTIQPYGEKTDIKAFLIYSPAWEKSTP